jgi:hypothetical protein
MKTKRDKLKKIFCIGGLLTFSTSLEQKKLNPHGPFQRTHEL